jgi:cytochrome b6-f complex iron-sulfur subunit
MGWIMNTNSKSPSRLSRRGFLGVLWGASLAGLFAQAGAALYEFFQPRVTPGSFGSKVNAGKAKEFKPGKVSYVRQGHFYISRLEDGGVLAMWHRCTHLGCTVPWRQDEGQFHCPCHSSLYNTRGEVIGGPAPRPLDLFPIEVVNDDLIVDTGHPINRDKYDQAQALRV